MLIKFTTGGRGSGRQVAEYLTRHDNREHSPPEVVRGDMDRTCELIDSQDRKWTYTHGVLSFAPEDQPSLEQQQEAMDLFERAAFAGLDRDQYDISWVRHDHTESGRVELHFVTPRMELTTGKALNIAPPGWERHFAPLRDALNHEHGWARPDDPERAVELQGAPVRLREGLTLREGREAVHGHLTALVAMEQVTDRASAVQALQDAGLEVPRQGKDYLTVRDPETGEKWRMKGRIYEKDWIYDAELDRAAGKEAGQSVGRDRGVDRSRAQEARHELEDRMRARAEQHQARYPRSERHDRELAHDVALATLDRSGLHRDRDRLLSASLGRDMVDTLGPGRSAQPGQSAERGFSADRGADGRDHVSEEPTGAVRGAAIDRPDRHVLDLRRAQVPEIEGLSHEPTDSLRARVTRTVRDLGERLRERAGWLADNVRGIARAVGQRAQALEPDRAETTRDRELSSTAVRSLERAERADRELGSAGERVVARTAEMRRERERQYDRGFGMSM